MKKIIILIIAIVIIIAGVYLLNRDSSDTTNLPPPPPTGATPPPPAATDTTKTVIGKSVENRDITAYHYGTGNKEILFVGGVHGGYSWNTALLGYELMDYLEANPSAIPSSLRVTVIPVMNPDGLNKVVGTTGEFTKANVSTSQNVVISGRFNANNVDLNRNFDCAWQSQGTWQNRTVSGGTAAFSEVETKAFRDYIAAHKPTAAIVWHSAAGGVFPATCQTGISSNTRTLSNTYATASGYKAYESFDFYQVTGDMANWLSKQNIPAISVLLATHDSTEWTENQKGIDAVLKYYAK